MVMGWMMVVIESMMVDDGRWWLMVDVDGQSVEHMFRPKR